QFKHKAAVAELIDANGIHHFFSHYDKRGNAVYFTLENESSAISSKIDRIRTGGSTGLDLDGSDIIFGLWDSGNPRVTHQEFNGNINIIDTAAFTSHSTHIGGILIAEGIVPAAKGMAPSASIDSYTSSGWNSEVALWAAAGGMISSHSYIVANPREDFEKFGIYNVHSQNWDALSYNAPYLIMSTGASNNGSLNFNPDGSRYDLLASNKLGKNSIVVGACADVLDYTGPESVRQAFFTSWGPTDDWRIKPDITAVGLNSSSTREANDTSYGTGQGSSFAAPIVSGGLGLLQQYYHNLNSVYMKGATAKALILSTTDEAGEHDGPDFSNGWGLFNAEKAAEVITNNGTSAIIAESILNQDEIISLAIEVDGTEPLTVAVCWNDPPSEPFADEPFNDPTPMLINDLDVRVTSSSETFFPWMMEPNDSFDNYTDAATKGDNFRDNIEIINVENIEAGTYNITISAKGILQTGSQDFSLIVNGLRSETTSSTQSNTLDESISVYPNPATNSLKIEYAAPNNEELKVSIYSITGQKQIETNFYNQNTIELDVSDLSKGIYLLEVQNDNLVSTRKIIVN
ncbi:S8 family peptidase, partial [Saprospiraceae bacterium]|nr:S8 family peptidase [Saprospiraceae bacterium]